MTVTTETATVYKGGGRRYFSKSAAIHSEARAAYRVAIKSKDRCDCSTEFHEGFGDYNDTCKYHDHSEPVYGRYIRFAEHCIKKASNT